MSTVLPTRTVVHARGNAPVQVVYGPNEERALRRNQELSGQLDRETDDLDRSQRAACKRARKELEADRILNEKRAPSISPALSRNVNFQSMTIPGRSFPGRISNRAQSMDDTQSVCSTSRSVSNSPLPTRAGSAAGVNPTRLAPKLCASEDSLRSASCNALPPIRGNGWVTAQPPATPPSPGSGGGVRSRAHQQRQTYHGKGSVSSATPDHLSVFQSGVDPRSLASRSMPSLRADSNDVSLSTFMSTSAGSEDDTDGGLAGRAQSRASRKMGFVNLDARSASPCLGSRPTSMASSPIPGSARSSVSGARSPAGGRSPGAPRRRTVSMPGGPRPGSKQGGYSSAISPLADITDGSCSPAIAARPPRFSLGTFGVDSIASLDLESTPGSPTRSLSPDYDDLALSAASSGGILTVVQSPDSTPLLVTIHGVLGPAMPLPQTITADTASSAAPTDQRHAPRAPVTAPTPPHDDTEVTSRTGWSRTPSAMEVEADRMALSDPSTLIFGPG
ncbi:uncharacterized protein LOC135820157 [Sycon ciliatum]|uniref:uncharacterized protein LOC135820157 n=1 Tax=Sycon ciliatum TaxID=27933 RepID=UPI0031F68ABC